MGAEDHAAKYPEHQKLRAVKDESQSIGMFIEWLRSTNREICRMRFGSEYFPIDRSIEKLLAEYFEIDLDKIEDEKDQMVDELRAMNERLDGP